jgi:hypothetical protein
MSNNIREPEERRQVIINGINKDLNSQQIATQLGVKMGVVMRDLRAMKYNRDPELKQAYLDQEARLMAGRLILNKGRDDKFHLMAGMSLQEKSFENMVDFYAPELVKILESRDECAAITNLSKSVQRTMTHNEIIMGRKYKRQISPKARGYLSKRRRLPSKG